MPTVKDRASREPSSPAKASLKAHAKAGADASPGSSIDEIVIAAQSRAGLMPAPVVADDVFLRRVYLDVIGTLPTADEAREYLGSSAVNRRAALIDRLLERDEFNLYRAMKWSDVLCIKAEFPINLWPVAAQGYYRWLLDSLAANQPCDRFALELLGASGSNFRHGAVNFYRAVQSREPQRLAQAVARVFMGVRTEKWSATRRDEMALFFSQVGYKPTGEWKEEIVFHDPAKPLGAALATFPDGTPAQIGPGSDPRRVFAEWLTRAGNPFFARNLANRVWTWLYGRGIVDEPDDFRADNPPVYPELLDFLAAELVRSGFDQKHLYRLVLNAKIYQQSAIPRAGQDVSGRHFVCYPVRRLDAEVLIDALCQVTGTSEQYASAVPEPYTIMPGNQRAIALCDGSISSAFLEAFGRSPRNTGLEAERNSTPSTSQRLHLLNSTHIERKIEQGPVLDAIYRVQDLPGMIETLYLTILSRYPSDGEQGIAANHMRNANGNGNRRQACIDLAWALINSTEFMYRH